MIIDNFHDANGEAIQPYYAAYMIEFGYRTPSEARSSSGGNYEFMAWINSRWADFFADLGVKRPDHTSPFVGPFTGWLDHRATDQTARAHVEAA